MGLDDQMVPEREFQRGGGGGGAAAANNGNKWGLVRNQQLRTRFETKGNHSSAIKALAIRNPVQSATKPNDKNQLGTDALITAPLNSVKIT